MRKYQVTGQFTIEAHTATEAEDIVQNAVEGTANCIGTEDVTAEPIEDAEDGDYYPAEPEDL